ncbi:hypothetical protein [Sphingobacterium sp.]
MNNKRCKVIALILLFLLISINCIVAFNYYFIEKMDLPYFFIVQTDISPL